MNGAPEPLGLGKESGRASHKFLVFAELAVDLHFFSG